MSAGRGPARAGVTIAEALARYRQVAQLGHRFRVHVQRAEGGDCSACGDGPVNVVSIVKRLGVEVSICARCVALLQAALGTDDDIDACAFCGSGFALVDGVLCPDCGAIDSVRVLR